MVLDRWFHWDDKDRLGNYHHITNLLSEEEQTIKNLVQEEKYWEAFNRLNYLLLYCSHQLEPGESRDGTRNTPHTTYALLEWIAANKQLIDEIVQGIEGDGYGISTSLYGVSISVSFGSGGIGAQPATGGVQVKSGGMSRALRPRTRTSSPSAMRSNVKNPNNPAYRSSRGGGRSR